MLSGHEARKATAPPARSYGRALARFPHRRDRDNRPSPAAADRTPSDSPSLNFKSKPPSGRVRLRSPLRVKRRTPAAFASASRQAITVSDESVTGNIRPSSSRFSRTPRASNHAIVSSAENRWNGEINSRSPRGYRSVNVRGSKRACVTLQRPPPEMRTLVRNCEVRSKRETSRSRFACAQAIAAKNPAAPPPAITIRSRPTAHSIA